MAQTDIFAVEFENQREIRMGSPDVYGVTFTGLWQPDLQAHKLHRNGWGNVHAVSADQRYHTLVQWQISEDNFPGFHAVFFDTHNQSLQVSEWCAGIPETLHWHSVGHRFKVGAALVANPEGRGF